MMKISCSTQHAPAFGTAQGGCRPAFRRLGALAIAGIAIAALPGVALAQSNRTFISGAGSDSNTASNCSSTTPCRSFGAAIGKTNTGGEVVVLDSAGYGPFTIGKAITITATGVEAAITVTSSNGIDITAGTTDAVNLGGLTIVGSSGSAINGINLVSAGSLNIQNCSISGFSNDGISLSGAANVSISDTILANNGQIGVDFGPNAAASASLLRVQLLGNQVGFRVESLSAGGGAVAASVEDSVASGNTDIGFQATGASTLMLSNSQIFNNKFGIDTQGTAAVNLAQVAIFGNTTDGYIIEGGTINSFRTNASGTIYNGNYIVDTANSGTLTAAAPQ